MRRRTLQSTSLLVLLAALTAAAAQNSTTKPERPRDPWVFRCVLDNRPRIVVLALHKDLYVAYDTTDCSLYKAWRGDVKFDGAVYTTVHGPQPTSQGVDYLSKTEEPAWTIRRGGQPIAHPSPRWLGYRFLGDHVVLRYSVEVDGETIVILERPEVRLVGDEVTFERHVSVEGLAKATRLGIAIPVRDVRGSELRLFINDRPMKLKQGDTSKSVDLPVSADVPVKVVTYMSTSADAQPANPKAQEP